MPGALTGSAEESAPSINHEVRLTGLTPATHYYYAVEAGETPPASGPSFHFFAPQADGAADSVRFWVLGDCGTQTAAQRMVRDAFAPLHAQRRADLWLMLGDNAYYNATDALYQGAVFDMFPGLPPERAALVVHRESRNPRQGPNTSSNPPLITFSHFPPQANAAGWPPEPSAIIHGTMAVFTSSAWIP